jgi:hypothetical protein
MGRLFCNLDISSKFVKNLRYLLPMLITTVNLLFFKGRFCVGHLVLVS